MAQLLHRTQLDDDWHDASDSTNGEWAKAHALWPLLRSVAVTVAVGVGVGIALRGRWWLWCW